VADFTPDQLDRLEDALERLDGDADGDAGLEPETVARLLEYRRVMAVAREALPLEDVADHALDGVRAEARQVAARPRPERPGLWARWRRTIWPALALAGTAAAVLWIVQPERAVHEPIAAPPATPPAVAPAAASVGPPPASQPAPASERADLSRAAEEISTTLPGAAATAAPAREPGAAGDGYGARGKRDTRQDDAMPAKPEPEAPTDKDASWSLIDRAEDRIRLGDCPNARQLYEQARGSAYDVQARARIEAGLGVCEDLAGRDAATHWSNARALDPASQPLIDDLLEQARSATKKLKPAQAAKKSKAAPDAQSLSDPAGE
jgi:hypothetical protein